MNRKSLLTFLFLSLAALLFTGCATKPERDRVVFHVSGPDQRIWNQALNNIKNVQDAYGGAENVDVALVVYGFGIDMLKADAPTANRVTATAKTGVNIVACETTMRGRKLTKEDMNPSIGYVPGGVIELMRLQKEGWAYVKP